MFNKLKYPARGDLLIWGIEFVEGTGASYLLEVLLVAHKRLHELPNPMSSQTNEAILAGNNQLS